MSGGFKPVPAGPAKADIRFLIIDERPPTVIRVDHAGRTYTLDVIRDPSGRVVLITSVRVPLDPTPMAQAARTQAEPAKQIIRDAAKLSHHLQTQSAAAIAKTVRRGSCVLALCEAIAATDPEDKSGGAS